MTLVGKELNLQCWISFYFSSARLGLQEDLEDMRKEEEELRQKKLAKMKKMKYR